MLGGSAQLPAHLHALITACKLAGPLFGAPAVPGQSCEPPPQHNRTAPFVLPFPFDSVDEKREREKIKEALGPAAQGWTDKALQKNPKTGEVERIVPMTRWSVDEVQEVLERGGATGLAVTGRGHGARELLRLAALAGLPLFDEELKVDDITSAYASRAATAHVCALQRRRLEASAP